MIGPGESRARGTTPAHFLAALSSLGFAVRSTIDPRGVLAAVPDHLIGLTRADRGVILMHDPDSGELGGIRFEAGSDVVSSPCRVVPRAETFLGRLLRRESLVIEHPGGLASDGDLDWNGQPAETLVGVPLSVGTSLLGVVVLAYGRRVNLGDRRRRALLLVAGQIALALDRARILEELDAARRGQQESRAAIRRMEESRADLVSIVSHELRTPLTAIKAYTETLLDNVGSPSFTMQEKFLGIINEECDRLSRMVNDVLDLSRMDSGKRRLRTELVSLNRLVEDVLPTVAPDLHAKRLHVMLDLEHDMPRVEVDPDLLQQVLVNLVANAAKFSRPDADITIRAGQIPAAAGAGSRWFLTIEDQGMGIAPEKLDRVFERFYRVEDSGTERVVGTGLGLAIVKSAVELHGGTIRAESEVGRGSRFVIDLPLHQRGFRTLMQTLTPFFERPELRLVLQNCVEMVGEVMEAGIVSFMFFDDEGAELRIQGAYGLDPDTVARTRVKVGDSIAGWVARTSENLLVEDVETDRRFRKMNHPQYETRSLLCVPLQVGGETVGVVNVSNKVGGAVFDADDLSLLVAISTRVGLSLERVRAAGDSADPGALLKAVRAVVRARRTNWIPGSRRMIRLAVELGRRLGLSPEDIDVLAYVTRIHDVGMLSVGDDLLESSRRWTDGEHRRVEFHPHASVQLLKPMEFASRVNGIILAHHEHYDGAGYPRGLRGEEIPLASRIVGVLDAFESMTQGRPYRAPMNEQDALAELKRCSGSQFDPRIVELFAQLLAEGVAARAAAGPVSEPEWNRDAVR